MTNSARATDQQRRAAWLASCDGRRRAPSASEIGAPHLSPAGRELKFITIPAGAERRQLPRRERRGGVAGRLADQWHGRT